MIVEKRRQHKPFSKPVQMPLEKPSEPVRADHVEAEKRPDLLEQQEIQRAVETSLIGRYRVGALDDLAQQHRLRIHLSHRPAESRPEPARRPLGVVEPEAIDP